MFERLKTKYNMTLIIDSLRGYRKYREIITGQKIFKINNFKLLSGEIISIVGDLNGIDFIFVNRGKIGFIGENCGINENIKKFPIVECPICYEEENIKYILCGHGICKSCVKSILKKKKEDRKCPTCRQYIGRIGNVISITKEKAINTF